MPITPKNGDLTAGVAGYWNETLNASPDPLVTGDTPAFMSMELPSADAMEFVAHQVGGFDATGFVAPAVIGNVDPADDITAIGFINYAPTGEIAEGDLVSVVRMGVFNPDLLVWDASYDTDEKKRLAFEGAPSPTAIVIRKPTTMTV